MSNPKQVKALRNKLGLTSAECASMVGLANFQAWQRYEYVGENARAIPNPTLRLFEWKVEHLPNLLAAIRGAGEAKCYPTVLAVLEHLVSCHETDPHVLCAAAWRLVAEGRRPVLSKPVAKLLAELDGPGPRSDGAQAIVLAALIQSLAALPATWPARRRSAYLNNALLIADAIEQPNPRLRLRFFAMAGAVRRGLGPLIVDQPKMRA